MVTVREKDCAGPMPTTRAGDQGVAGRLGGRGEAVVLREPVAVERRLLDLGAELGVLAPRALGDVAAQRVVGAEARRGLATTGPTAVRGRRPRPGRTPHRPRDAAGSIGESSPLARRG